MHDSKRRLLTWLVVRVVWIVYRRHRLLVALLRVLLRSTLLRVLLLGVALLGVTLLRVLLLLRITLRRVLLILRLHRRCGSLVTVLRLLTVVRHDGLAGLLELFADFGTGILELTDALT